MPKALVNEHKKRKVRFPARSGHLITADKPSAAP